MMGYTKQELWEYYITTKQGLEDYETHDFLTILTSKVYQKLPFVVSRAVYTCLSRYMFLHKMYDDSNYTYRDGWTYEDIDKDTGKNTKYSFDKPIELPFNLLEREIYRDFFTYYSKGVNEEYFTTGLNKEISYGKLGNLTTHHYPLNVYRAYMNGLTKVSYWYLGKRETDKIVNEFRGLFLTRLEETEYTYNTQEIDELNNEIDNNYRLYRNRTKLNKRKPIIKG